MTELLNLGHLYVSDFLGPDEQPRAEPAELKLVMDDDTGIVHLNEQPPAELMWGAYWYRSGTNESMRNELYDIVTSIEQVTTVDRGQIWVDIASNDGTLLSFVDTKDSALGRLRIGVDPVTGAIHDEATHHADLVLQESFTIDTIDKIVGIGHGRAKVITCIAMFYDLLDPTNFLRGVHDLLDRDGVFVLQMSYTPLMLEQLAFDNICHEHARYYTLDTLRHVLYRGGFDVLDVQLNATNGGSFRVYAMRDDADHRRFATQPYRDVAQYRINSILRHEHAAGYNDATRWLRWWEQIQSLRGTVRQFIEDARTDGNTVWGYGASTKGNTLLQYFGLDHTMIEGIAERQEAKWGLRTVGTSIPITSEDDWRTARPNFTLMLPWHFVNEFTRREAKYLEDGGRFIVPCPRFEIIGA